MENFQIRERELDVLRHEQLEENAKHRKMGLFVREIDEPHVLKLRKYDRNRQKSELQHEQSDEHDVCLFRVHETAVFAGYFPVGFVESDLNLRIFFRLQKFGSSPRFVEVGNWERHQHGVLIRPVLKPAVPAGHLKVGHTQRERHDWRVFRLWLSVSATGFVKMGHEKRELHQLHVRVLHVNHTSAGHRVLDKEIPAGLERDFHRSRVIVCSSELLHGKKQRERQPVQLQAPVPVPTRLKFAKKRKKFTKN